MTHILDNRLAIDVDNDHRTGWPNGLQKLADARLEEGQKIDIAFFDSHMRDGSNALVVTKETLDEWRDVHHRIAGLRFGPNWYGWPEPGTCAKIISDEIGRFEDDGIKRAEVIEYDVEPPHNTPQETAFYFDWQVKFLLGYVKQDNTIVKGIRGAGGQLPNPKNPQTLGYRWGRPFVYTFEGRQTEKQAAAATAARAGGKVGPQPYNGKMDEVWDDLREFTQWVRSGIVPPNLFTLFRNAKRGSRPLGMREGVLFATSLLTELYV